MLISRIMSIFYRFSGLFFDAKPVFDSNQKKFECFYILFSYLLTVLIFCRVAFWLIMSSLRFLILMRARHERTLHDGGEFSNEKKIF